MARPELPPIPVTGPPCWRCGVPTHATHPEIGSAWAVYACHECRATLWKGYHVGGYRPVTWKEYRAEIGHPSGSPLKRKLAPKKE